MEKEASCDKPEELKDSCDQPEEYKASVCRHRQIENACMTHISSIVVIMFTPSKLCWSM
jgi:hypothetical protein